MTPISVLLPPEMKSELMVRAAQSGEPNQSAYVRSLFDAAWGREDRNHALTAALDRLAVRLDRAAARDDGVQPSAIGDAAMLHGALMELLLLLRSVVKPDSMRMVQSELDRIGLPVWKSTMFNKESHHE